MNHQHKERILTQAIAKGFNPELDISRIGKSRWEFRVPHGDQHGEPLWFSIDLRGGDVTIDDGGAVAGLLFALEQDKEGDPAFDLLTSLASRHDMRLDYEQGVVKRRCSLDKVGEVLPSFTRIVLSILTAAPHLVSGRNGSEDAGEYASVQRHRPHILA